MTIRLFVRPLSPSANPFHDLEWSLYSYGGERLGGGVANKDQLKEVTAQYSLEDVYLHFILPASDFSFLTASVPVKQARHVQQALPYAIEESIAEDIEDVQLFIGEKSSKQEYPVLAINKDRMQSWYSAIQEIAFPLYGIYIDAQLCWFDGADITVLVDDEYALIYHQEVCCLRTPLSNLLLYLELLSAESDQAIRLSMMMTEQAKSIHNVLIAEVAQIEGLESEVSTFSTSVFEVLCASFFNTEKPLNLCGPDFPGNTQVAASGLKKWWPLAAVATFWLIVQTGLDLAEGYLHQRQAQEYREQSTAVYRALFPAERTVANPRRQLEGKLRNADNIKSDSGFLVMLGEAGYHLSQQPQKSRMTLNNMQYSENRGELALEISAPGLDDLDRYKESIAEAGYRVTIGSAIKEANYVRGKLTLQGG